MVSKETIILGTCRGKIVSMKTKADAVDEIGRLLTALADRFDDGPDAEREYLAQQLPDALVARCGDLPTMAVHLLAGIGDAQGDSVNIVGLAAQSGQLKGTVSKQVQRLVEAGLVERGPVPGNRKEIRLSLTHDGQVFARVHQQMHDEMDRGLHEFLLRYTGAELATVTKVLGDLLRTERRGVMLFTDKGR
jgi:DNA-binding MarR family transcriptional regulator